MDPLHGFGVSVAEEEVRHAAVNAHVGTAPPAQVSATASVLLDDDNFLGRLENNGLVCGRILCIGEPP